MASKMAAQTSLRRRICFESLPVAGINHPLVEETTLKFCETTFFDEGFSLRRARGFSGIELDMASAVAK